MQEVADDLTYKNWELIMINDWLTILGFTFHIQQAR